MTIRICAVRFVELHSLCREESMEALTGFVLASMLEKVWKQAAYVPTTDVSSLAIDSCPNIAIISLLPSRGLDRCLPSPIS